MAEIGEENKVDGVFGGVNLEENDFQEVNFEGSNQEQAGVVNRQDDGVFKKIEVSELPAKQSPWTRIKNFLFQDIDLTAPIKVELTPYQQKIEDEINEFLHQEISFKGFFDLFKKSK